MEFDIKSIVDYIMIHIASYWSFINSRDNRVAAKIARRLINRLINRTCVLKLH